MPQDASRRVRPRPERILHTSDHCPSCRDQSAEWRSDAESIVVSLCARPMLSPQHGLCAHTAPKFRPRSRTRFLLSRSQNLQWGRIRRLLPSAPRHFRWIGKVAGRGERENALVALRKERPLKQTTALVVEKVFVPAIFNERGYDHHDPPLRTLCGKFESVLDERDDDETVGRREDGEVGWILTGFAEGSFDVTMPIILQQFGVLARLDVNGNDF
jgi:hypothetical protein